MAVELSLGTSGYGGALQLTPTGDLLKVMDTPGNPVASQQLLTRIILTNPGDDIFNPDFGSGARADIGEDVLPALTTKIQNNILAAIAANANFAPTPAPIVTVSVDGMNDGQVFVQVTAFTISGDIVTAPSLPLQNFAQPQFV